MTGDARVAATTREAEPLLSQASLIQSRARVRYRCNSSARPTTCVPSMLTDMAAAPVPSAVGHYKLPDIVCVSIAAPLHAHGLCASSHETFERLGGHAVTSPRAAVGALGRPASTNSLQPDTAATQQLLTAGPQLFCSKTTRPCECTPARTQFRPQRCNKACAARVHGGVQSNCRAGWQARVSAFLATPVRSRGGLAMQLVLRQPYRVRALFLPRAPWFLPRRPGRRHIIELSSLRLRRRAGEAGGSLRRHYA
jgi:hypothetical protein